MRLKKVIEHEQNRKFLKKQNSEKKKYKKQMNKNGMKTKKKSITEIEKEDLNLKVK